jgi:hypothetical protein
MLVDSIFGEKEIIFSIVFIELIDGFSSIISIFEIAFVIFFV